MLVIRWAHFEIYTDRCPFCCRGWGLVAHVVMSQEFCLSVRGYNVFQMWNCVGVRSPLIYLHTDPISYCWLPAFLCCHAGHFLKIFRTVKEKPMHFGVFQTESIFFFKSLSLLSCFFLRTKHNATIWRWESGRERCSKNAKGLSLWFTLSISKWQMPVCITYRQTSDQTSWMQTDRLQCRKRFRQRQPDMTRVVLWLHFKMAWSGALE